MSHFQIYRTTAHTIFLAKVRIYRSYLQKRYFASHNTICIKFGQSMTVEQREAYHLIQKYIVTSVICFAMLQGTID